MITSDIHWNGKRIEGVVFDIDGTLTNSIEVYYDWFRAVAARFGIYVRKENVLEPMAVTGFISWERAIPLGTPDRHEKVKQIKRLISQALNEVHQRVQLLPGVGPVIEYLAQKGVRLGAVTSSKSFALRPLHEHSLIRYFGAIITGEEGLPQKPEPAGILECMRRMHITPNHTVTIGDSPLDIRAGKKAGTLTIGVLGGIASRSQLEAETPNAIVEDVPQVLSVFKTKETFPNRND